MCIYVLKVRNAGTECRFDFESVCQIDIACDLTSLLRAASPQPIMWTLAIVEKLLYVWLFYQMHHFICFV